MTIIVENKNYDNIEQALIELAFCHYPVRVKIDDKEYCFEEFSTVEKLLKSMKEA